MPPGFCPPSAPPAPGASPPRDRGFWLAFAALCLLVILIHVGLYLLVNLPSD